MKSTAKKKDGFLKLLKPKEVEIYLDKYNEDQHFDIEITLPEEKHSDRQRRYYFGGIINFAAEILKISPGDLHAYYKSILLMELQELKGQVFAMFRPENEFRKLSVKRMTIYINNVRADLRDPDNIFKTSIDTEDPEDFWKRRNDGVLL